MPQEWVACLGHASITAAVHIAERSFAAWRALADAALSRGMQEGRGFQDAAKEAEECYEVLSGMPDGPKETRRSTPVF